MNAATITALTTGIVGILGAVGALIHSLQTRSIVNSHIDAPVSPTTFPDPNPTDGGHM